jgi:hypothetical protein
LGAKIAFKAWAGVVAKLNGAAAKALDDETVRKRCSISAA